MGGNSYLDSTLQSLLLEGKQVLLYMLLFTQYAAFKPGWSDAVWVLAVWAGHLDSIYKTEQ